MPTLTEQVLADCPLAHGPTPGECGWCGKPLPRKKDGTIHPTRRWCSSDCSNAFSRNHSWGWARPAALERDGHRCVKCGAGPGPDPERPSSPRPWTYSGELREDATPEAIAEWEAYREATREAYDRRRSAPPLEVNHIEPRRGQGYGFGCPHHHLENLETLCRPCHVEVTTEQRRARKHAEQHARIVAELGEETAAKWEASRRELGLVPGDPDDPPRLF